MSKINKNAFKGVEETPKIIEDTPVINLKLKKIIEEQKKLEESLKSLIKETPSKESLIQSLIQGFSDGIQEILEPELSEFAPKMQIAANNKNKNLKK